MSGSMCGPWRRRVCRVRWVAPRRSIARHAMRMQRMVGAAAGTDGTPTPACWFQSALVPLGVRGPTIRSGNVMPLLCPDRHTGSDRCTDQHRLRAQFESTLWLASDGVRPDQHGRPGPLPGSSVCFQKEIAMTTDSMSFGLHDHRRRRHARQDRQHGRGRRRDDQVRGVGRGRAPAGGRVGDSVRAGRSRPPGRGRQRRAADRSSRHCRSGWPPAFSLRAPTGCSSCRRSSRAAAASACACWIAPAGRAAPVGRRAGAGPRARTAGPGLGCKAADTGRRVNERPTGTRPTLR